MSRFFPPFNRNLASLKHTIFTYLSQKQCLVRQEGWEKSVTIVSSDMRCWDAPEKADVLVFIFFLLFLSLVLHAYCILCN